MGWTHRPVGEPALPLGLCDALNALPDRQLETASRMMAHRAQADLHAEMLAASDPDTASALGALDGAALRAASDWARSVARERRDGAGPL